jgi:excisionase family DNA binding protein
MTEAHLLSVPEAAQRLGIDVRLARKMLGWGQLPSVKVGSRRMVPEGAVAQFIRDAQAARIGSETALRVFALIAAALDEAPHVTGEDGR